MPCHPCAGAMLTCTCQHTFSRIACAAPHPSLSAGLRWHCRARPRTCRTDGAYCMLCPWARAIQQRKPGALQIGSCVSFRNLDEHYEVSMLPLSQSGRGKQLSRCPAIERSQVGWFLPRSCGRARRKKRESVMFRKARQSWLSPKALHYLGWTMPVFESGTSVGHFPALHTVLFAHAHDIAIERCLTDSCPQRS